MADAMSTHPASKDRVSQANELRSKLQNRPGAADNSKEFYEMKRTAQAMVEATARKAKAK